MTLTREQERRQWTNQKSALTRAVNSGDPAKIIATTKKAVAQWEEKGYWPDAWHRWNIALSDAYNIARQAYGSGETDEVPDASDYDIDAIRRKVVLGA